MLCPQIKITVPHGLISHYLCFLSIFPKSGMKLFQLNNNKKNSPLDLPKPRKRQISMYYSVKKTSDGDYPKYSLLFSFREATFQKNKQNNMLKTVLNMQLLRISSHLLFKAACQVVFPSWGDLDGSPFSKPFTKKAYSSVVEHVTLKSFTRSQGPFLIQRRRGMYFSLVFQHREVRLWVWVS